jgi:ankyrin repeat protein
MPTAPDVVRLNLEYYRKQAKALLKASRAGDPNALQRLRRQSAKLNPPTKSTAEPVAPALHDAQLAIAREQGFLSWARFKAFIVEWHLDFQGLVASFIDAAVSKGKRAEAILAAHPEIANAGFYVALVLGDWKQVERTLVETPALATAKSGPQNCEPLLYVCFSRYARGKSSRAADLVETARVLLRHGAGPNAFFIPEDVPDNPLSCLYAASGLNNNPALTQALLEARANPNDSESLYHSTEHADLACVKLLLRHGATPKGTNALKHMLDREDLEGLQLLLTAGANPNETNDQGETALHWAVWRGRSAKTIATLLDHGADLNTARTDGRTAYALAVLTAQTEVVALLAERGAKADLSGLDQLVGACANASPEELGCLLASYPEIVASPANTRLLPDLATGHHTSAVRALLAAGVPVDTRGQAGGTALHWACWKGYADLVELLLSHGASLAIEDEDFHAPPSGWLHHGTQNCPDRDGDYARVARLLFAAGAPMQTCNTPTGNVEVDAVLREHKLIE